jgi:hypothetical protein
MNSLKKYLGAVWMLLAPVLVVFMFWQAYEKINAAPAITKANTALQWSIILIIFLPICAGLFIFGRYGWHGDYAHLPESSEEIDDYEGDVLV